MLTPAWWPEVRRGTERMVHELATGLADRGHRATVVTSHRGPPGRAVEDGVPVLRLPRPPDGRLRRRWYEDYLTHVPLSYGALRLGRYDVAHAWFQTDALAAARWGRRTGRPVVLSYMGIPDHTGLMFRRRRLQITQAAADGADRVVVLSRYAAAEFRRWLGVESDVIPPPVDVETFRPGPTRHPEPTIVCAGVADEPRKRVDLLVRALPLVRRERPATRVVVLRPADPRLAASLQAAGAQLAEPMGDRDDLARFYASAWVNALPSVGEAFGMVLAEGLACGTPGVGTDGHGIREVLDRPAVGRRFDGDERDLARALLEALELAEDPATPDACRARAMEFSRERCVESYERLYGDLLNR